MNNTNRIWTVSSKGGVGTSTVCVNLARAFAAAGQRVLLVDLDTAAPSLDMLLGVDNSVYDVRDALLGRIRVADAVVHLPQSPNMYLLCGTLDPTADLPLTTLDSVLSEAEQTLGVSVILLNTHGPGHYAKTVASSVTDTLLVTHPGALSVHVAEQCGIFLKSINAPNIKLVINQYDMELAEPPLISLIDAIGVQLLAVIPDDKDMAKAQLSGKMAKEGAGQNTICAFRNMAHRIRGQHAPLFSHFTGIKRRKLISHLSSKQEKGHS